MMAGAIESFVVVFREGFEAMLVVVTLAALLEGRKQNCLLKYLYWSAIAAISLAVAVVFVASWTHYDNPALDALVLCFSAAIMVYMARDLFLWRWRRAGEQKKASIEARAFSTIYKSGALGISALTFTVVFREGLEASIFLHATSIAQGGWTSGMVWGVHAALVPLIGAFFFLKYATCKLPISYIIAGTSASFLIQAGVMLSEVFL